jgi:hypothetical protein
MRESAFVAALGAPSPPSSMIKSRSQAAAEAATDDTRETPARRVQNVPATANCTSSPLKTMIETAPASISAQRKAAGHRGMKAPVNMEKLPYACRNGMPT